jgi:hypothetical protein
MVLRLVLVSIVAGLGATPPAESEVAGWSRAVQVWLDARVAEWNLAPARDGCISTPPTGVPATDLDVAALERELMAVFAAEPVVEQAAAAPASTGQGQSDLDFAAVVEEMVAAFSQVAAEAPAPEPKAPAPPAPSSATIVADEAEALEAEIVEAELAGGDSISTVAAPAMATLPAGEDEWLAIADEFDLFPAFEPVREAPLAVVPPTTPEEAPAATTAVTPPAGNPLRDAVRLTRDAVFAWLNLLQSPALVTVPQ